LSTPAQFIESSIRFPSQPILVDMSLTGHMRNAAETPPYCLPGFEQ
jgi:hypothetical protein